LWGYELTYPDDWTHITFGEAEGFIPNQPMLEPGDEEPKPEHILVSAEWNCARQPIGPLWSQHIGLAAGMMGAKKVGSAPWRMAGAAGMEAEILMPAKEDRRLWAGILEKDFTLLKFLVTHTRQNRSWFEPIATRIISSLSFPTHVQGINLSPEGLPIPPGYSPTDPRRIIPDIADPMSWRAYDGGSQVGALQAFYLRESPNCGWHITEYVPFPSASDLGFARIHLEQGARFIVLGIMPFGGSKVTSASTANLVWKIESLG
jgi:hypothetical protein